MIEQPEIRNSMVECLIFLIEGNEDGVPVVNIDESIWYTQKTMPQLFDEGVAAISKYPKIASMYSNNFYRELSTSDSASTSENLSL